MALQKLTLSNILEGRAEKMFERELKKIQQNIADVSTDAKKKRKITIEFDFVPSSDRTSVEVTGRTKTTTAPVSDIEGQTLKLSYAKGLHNLEMLTEVEQTSEQELNNLIEFGGK